MGPRCLSFYACYLPGRAHSFFASGVPWDGGNRRPGPCLEAEIPGKEEQAYRDRDEKKEKRLPHGQGMTI